MVLLLILSMSLLLGVVYVDCNVVNDVVYGVDVYTCWACVVVAVFVLFVCY